MDEMEEIKKITIELDEKTAEQLAVFCEGAFLDRIKSFSASFEEARLMQKALVMLGFALEDKGFAPR
jgi:hypothetical protein